MEKLPTVDIFFNCWEKTYSKVLDAQFISDCVRQNHFHFNNIFVVINDVEDRQGVEKIAKNLIEKRIITDFFFIDEYIERAFEIFGLTKEEFGKEYYLTNWAFVMPLLARSEYFVRWDEHARLLREGDWITPCLKELESNPFCLVGTPVGPAIWEKEGAFNATSEFHYSYIFSDIVFLAKTKKFLKPIYKYWHFFNLNYPLCFSGFSFEMRVSSFMRHTNKVRFVSKAAEFAHVFPMGVGYPRLSLREKLKAKLYGVVQEAFCIIYDPIHNKYSIDPRRIRPYIRGRFSKIVTIFHKRIHLFYISK